MSRSLIKNKFRNTITICVVAVRFLAALSILLDPFWGLVLILTLDILDSQILLYLVGLGRYEYERLDKLLDWIAYPIMIYASLKTGLFMVLLFLLLFRGIGQLLYIKTNREKYMIFFPNFFEVAFFVFVGLKSKGLNIDDSNILLWIMVTGFTLLREFVLHFITPRYLWNRGSQPLLYKWLGLKVRRRL